MRSRTSLAATCLTLTLAFASLPRQSRGTDRDAALQQALGSQEPVYNFSPPAMAVLPPRDALYKLSPGQVAAAVKLCASRDPGHAGAYVALVLHSGRNDADAIAPSLVQAAIQGLGADPKSSLIADIVRAAVTAAPSEVLDIVTAAVKASPRGAAPAIVQASVSSVPHPENLITVNIERRAERALGDGKQIDGKQAAAPAEKQLTIAEAIVQAAIDADPGLSAESLTTTVDEEIGSPIASNLTHVLAPVVPVLPSVPGPVSP